jgi:hypothetical protein
MEGWPSRRLLVSRWLQGRPSVYIIIICPKLDQDPDAIPGQVPNLLVHGKNVSHANILCNQRSSEEKREKSSSRDESLYIKGESWDWLHLRLLPSQSLFKGWRMAAHASSMERISQWYLLPTLLPVVIGFFRCASVSLTGLLILIGIAVRVNLCRMQGGLSGDPLRPYRPGWKIFWLTAVPLPHAGYVFIYVAFTTELLQIF